MKRSDEIKKIREILCVSQEELAQLLGVSFVSVNRWENSHYEPTIKAKRKIIYLMNNLEEFYKKENLL